MAGGRDTAFSTESEFVALLDFIAVCRETRDRADFIDALARLDRDVLRCESITLAACARGARGKKGAAPECQCLAAASFQLQGGLPRGTPAESLMCGARGCVAETSRKDEPSCALPCLRLQTPGAEAIGGVYWVSCSDNRKSLSRASVIVPYLLPYIEQACLRLLETGPGRAIIEAIGCNAGTSPWQVLRDTRAVQEDSTAVLADPALTAREVEVLRWTARGKGCWETAAILHITERTVKFHLQNVYRKLNAVNRAQAVAKAAGSGLI